jgi:serine/threonine-protein kinase
VVHVVDMGRLRSGAFYLVLEYLKGSDLNAMVAGDGPLSPARSVEVALQLCAALGCVHAAGIVHRDIKPQNVFLTDAPQACVKLLDFGICKVPEDIDQATPLAATRTGSLVGSPEYMAPEQIEGGRLDARTDIYGLGATLHFVLTGRPPFAASSLPRLLVQICEAPPPALPAHLQVFGGILARALAKRPEDRFLDATELRAALARV